MPDPTLGVAAIAAGTGLIGANKSSSAASKASAAQTDAAYAGIDEQRRQFDAVQEMLAPFVGGGSAAYSEMLALAGLAPQGQSLTSVDPFGMPAGSDVPISEMTWDQKLAHAAGVHNDMTGRVSDATGLPVGAGGATTPQMAQEAAMGRVANDPRLLYQMEQAEEALLANAAATGGVRGGNTAGMLAELRPALYSQAIDRRYSELGGIASMGQASATGQVAAAQNMGNNVSNLYGQIGAAQAGGALGQANAFNMGLGGVARGLGYAAAGDEAQQLFSQWAF